MYLCVKIREAKNGVTNQYSDTLKNDRSFDIATVKGKQFNFEKSKVTEINVICPKRLR